MLQGFVAAIDHKPRDPKTPFLGTFPDMMASGVGDGYGKALLLHVLLAESGTDSVMTWHPTKLWSGVGVVGQVSPVTVRHDGKDYGVVLPGWRHGTFADDMPTTGWKTVPYQR
jgi:hypothetical protein